MRNVTSAMPDGIVLLTENDHIEWCNPIAEDHLGISSTLDIGQQITHLVRQVPFFEYLAARNFSKPLVLNQTRRRQKNYHFSTTSTLWFQSEIAHQPRHYSV